MHIPDGYISPQTAGGLWALMVPAWYWAGYQVRRTLRARQAPLIAIGAAFTFVIMMFNIPVPGGTTGHIVGGTLVAVVIGPWAAVIAITVALVVQALFFGDGGILTLGANCFNIGLALPLTGYLVYRLFTLGAPLSSARQWLGAGLGAYAGVNMAALLTAIEIGVQPGLFHTADGTALYAPYGLSQAVPAMMFAHLLVVGVLEGAVTASAVAYLKRTNPGLLYAAGGDIKAGTRKLSLRPLLTAILLMLVFVPLGLLSAGSAWGEWSADEVRGELGFAPSGMERFSGLWRGVLPDYGFPGQSGNGFWASTPAYLLSSLIGLALVAAAALLIIHLLKRRAGQDV